MVVRFGERVCSNLLKDHTTQQNIYWATHSYKDQYGEGYTFFDPITLDKITGEGKDRIVRPRALKTKEEQTQRIKDNAEVFTPEWVCNAQNNLIDEAWFGRNDGLFNMPDPNAPHKWINNEEHIIFPDTEGKTWKDYVADVRLEITCGEAPYLCNRYDVVTGEYNEVAKYRIGLLDRKLRIVSENTEKSGDWLTWAKVALRATYGYDWQGDNVLLAREALFCTFIEHYIEKFGEKEFNRIKRTSMPGVAYIVSWNIWQMDGLKFGLPGHEPYIEKKQQQLVLPFEMPPKREIEPHKRLCLVKDFLYNVNLKKKDLSNKDFLDKSQPQITFKSLVDSKN